MRLKVREYLTSDGRSPFADWLRALDVATRARIQARVLRFEGCNLGDHKSVGGGVLEARVNFGPGYRVYFALEGSVAVLLLVGGDKSSQQRDIRNAQSYWDDYRKAKAHGTTK